MCKYLIHILLLVFFVSLSSCVSKSEYNDLVVENERLIEELSECKHGEERLYNLVRSYIDSGDILKARVYFDSLKQKHPESLVKEQVQKLEKEIKSGISKIEKRVEKRIAKREKEQRRKEKQLRLTEATKNAEKRRELAEYLHVGMEGQAYIRAYGDDFSILQYDTKSESKEATELFHSQIKRKLKEYGFKRVIYTVYSPYGEASSFYYDL